MPDPFFTDDSVTLYQGDAIATLRELPAASVDCCVTSPPYFGLRDYGVAGQYGLEPTVAEYVETMRDVFTEVRRVLADHGTLWLNLGDSYSGKANGGETYDRHRGHGHRSGTGMLPPRINNGDAARYKSLLGVPWRVAFALQDDGWILRNAIIWDKPNAMPESIQDRLANRYEHLFMFSKCPRYYFDLYPIREDRAESSLARYRYEYGAQTGRYGTLKPGAKPRTDNTVDLGKLNPGGKNPGDVWRIPTVSFTDAHFATYPPDLVRRALLSGCAPQVCRTCGVIPTRIIETEQLSTGRTTNGPRSVARKEETAGFTTRTVAARTMTGWTDCGHGDFRAGVALDPFSGSGTTGLVAGQLGLRYVGIDLSAEYLDLSIRTRLSQAPLFDPPQEGIAP